MSKQNPVNPKVTAATIGAGAGTIVSEFVIWTADEVFWNGPATPDVPAPVAAFITLVVASALAFAAGWLRKDPAAL